MLWKKLLVACGFGVLGAGCGGDCEEASCQDAIRVVVTLPEGERDYTFTFATALGATTCEVHVPVAESGAVCGDTQIIRSEGTAGNVVEFFALSTNSLTIGVSSGSTVVLDDENLKPADEDYVENEETTNFCGGPCSTATVEKDLSDAVIP